jgi:hypothetical protein
LKGWSCCPKRTIEFDAFLKIEGCTIGSHSAVATKPVVVQEPATKVAELVKETKTPAANGAEKETFNLNTMSLAAEEKPVEKVSYYDHLFRSCFI